MSFILSIETSTHVGSVALHEGNELRVYHENFINNSHSEYLVKTIKDVFDEVKITASQLSAVAVSKGPGSYTGLRIGVSVAKGICYAYDVKLIGIETLKSMALEINELNLIDGFLCPMIDARRMEVYCQIFNKELTELSGVESKIIDEYSFREHLSKNSIYFFGNGSVKCKEVLNDKNSLFIDNIYPKAKFVGQLAIEKFNEGSFENLAYFEPYYLKEFIAKKPSGKNIV